MNLEFLLNAVQLNELNEETQNLIAKKEEKINNFLKFIRTLTK